MNQICVILFKIFKKKINTNHRYLNRINDLENRVLASGLLLNYPKIPVFVPIIHSFVPKHHLRVTLTFKRQFSFNLPNYNNLLHV